MIPFLWQRICHAMDGHEMVKKGPFKNKLTKAPIEYFKMFYADTAINDNPSGLMCGLDFYGIDHLLFATDMPYDNQLGDRKTRENINAIKKWISAIPTGKRYMRGMPEIYCVCLCDLFSIFIVVLSHEKAPTL